MNDLPGELIERLGAYLDEEQDEVALRAAGDWLRSNTVDIAALFDWLQAHPADKSRKARAQAVIRAALQLPLMPGPVCRPAPR